jgi:hypothetical protein
MFAGALGFWVQGASAQVVKFQDDFESNAVGTTLNSPPPIGTSWTDVSTGPFAANGISITDVPAIGTRSLKELRDGGGLQKGAAKGLSLPGVMVPGNTVEVKWKSNVEYRFNGPMQISLGHDGANYDSKQIAFIQISDSNPVGGAGGGGSYAYYSGPGHFQTFNNTTEQSTLNTKDSNENHWDSIRAVLHLTSAGPNSIGGTMDLFIDTFQNPAGEVQVANGAVLENTDYTGVADPTIMQFHLALGQTPNGEAAYLDDISITVVPEPSMLGLGAVVLGALNVRRSRR